jgi:hypothetical protein
MNLSGLIPKIPFARTGFKACVNGKIIHGCGECGIEDGGHNYAKKPFRFALVPTHYCDARIDDHAQDVIIFDPLNIPADCPFRVME